MTDDVRISNACLEKLLRHIMHEKDPVKFDELCSGLWLVLDKCDIFASAEDRVGRASNRPGSDQATNAEPSEACL